MGAWGCSVFANDTSCDIRDCYKRYLLKQYSDDEAYQKTYEDFQELIGTDEEILFWLTIAHYEWKSGRLTEDVKRKALEFIENDRYGPTFFENESDLKKWQKSVDKIRKEIESDMPPRKKYSKPKVVDCTPWEIGDIYAYQFNEEKIAKREYVSSDPLPQTTGMMTNPHYGKYIVIQKVGEAPSYNGDIRNIDCNVVMVFNKIFDKLPTLDDLDGIGFLPLSIRKREYKDSEDWLQRDFCIKVEMGSARWPQKKYFTFIGKRQPVNLDGVFYNGYFYGDKYPFVTSSKMHFKTYWDMLDDTIADLYSLNNKCPYSFFPHQEFPKDVLNYVRMPPSEWKLGEVYVYMEGNDTRKIYVALQKVNTVMIYDPALLHSNRHPVLNVVRIYDKLFDHIPTISELEGIRFLPSRVRIPEKTWEAIIWHKYAGDLLTIKRNDINFVMDYPPKYGEVISIGYAEILYPEYTEIDIQRYQKQSTCLGSCVHQMKDMKDIPYRFDDDPGSVYYHND